MASAPVYEASHEAAYLANEAFGWNQSQGQLGFFFAQASQVEVSTDSLVGTLAYQDIQAFVLAHQEEGGTIVLVAPSRKDIDIAIKLIGDRHDTLQLHLLVSFDANRASSLLGVSAAAEATIGPYKIHHLSRVLTGKPSCCNRGQTDKEQQWRTPALLRIGAPSQAVSFQVTGVAHRSRLCAQCSPAHGQVYADINSKAFELGAEISRDRHWLLEPDASKLVDWQFPKHAAVAGSFESMLPMPSDIHESAIFTWWLDSRDGVDCVLFVINEEEKPFLVSFLAYFRQRRLHLRQLDRTLPLCTASRS